MVESPIGIYSDPSSIVGSVILSSKRYSYKLNRCGIRLQEMISIFIKLIALVKIWSVKFGKILWQPSCTISSIIHTIKFENARRRYYETTVPAAFYDLRLSNNYTPTTLLVTGR